MPRKPKITYTDVADMTAGVEFAEATHEYKVNGLRVPSVSEIIAPLNDFSGIPPEVLDRAARRGTAVHLATELYDAGQLDFDSIHPEVAPYFDAYMAFVDDMKPSWSMVEVRGYNPRDGYCGTIDRVGFVKNELCVVDIKTSVKISPVAGVQLAAYQNLLRVHGIGGHYKDAGTMGGVAYVPPTRAVLHLKPDGYEFVKFCDDKNKSDFAAFTACRAIFNWKKGNK